MPARSSGSQRAAASMDKKLFNYFRCCSYRWYYAITVALLFLAPVESCMPQYEKELRYLNYYMGIAPANGDGLLDVNAAGINNYVEQASQLNCDLHSPCLWTNAPTDGLLDTSEFYLFDKVDTKQFPIQVRPGKASHNPGTLFLLAGNTTNAPQGAVLMSAPVLCQNSDGILTFEYWLHNRARIEVLQLRVNTAHGRLYVLARPQVDCHFLKSSGLCRVEIRKSMEPFRLGIRAHALGDTTIGSFAMINGIRYDANVCGTYEQPKFFNGQPLTRRMRQTRPIRTASDLNCGTNSGPNAGALFSDAKRCLWAAAAPLSPIDEGAPAHRDAASNQWAVGNSTYLWDTLVRTESRPSGEFLYQYIDPMADIIHLPQLRSVVVPCTRTASALTFKYWLSGGVQAQLCTLGTDNTELSCVYLNEADAPGPVRVDIDAADDRPFRFAFSVIKFPRTNGGVIALDEIEFSGRLCHEEDPAEEARENIDGGADAEETFLSPNEINSGVPKSQATPQWHTGARQYSSHTEIRRQRVLEALFRLQPLAAVVSEDGDADSITTFSPTLECDFDTSVCAHWSQHVEESEFVDKNLLGKNQRMFQLASVPLQSPFPHLDEEFRGNAAVAIFNDALVIPSSRLAQFSGSPENVEYALFTSQPISCAKNARLIVTYYSSGDTTLSVCADQHCVAQRRPRGNLSVTVSAGEPFRLRVMAVSSGVGAVNIEKSSRRRYSPTVSQMSHPRSAMERYRSRFATNRRRRPFRYRYEGVNHGTADSAEERRVAAARYPPFVLIKRIRAEGGFCRLETPAELACKALTCNFHDGSLCGYTNVQYHAKDGNFVENAGQGAIAQLSVASGRRAILRSPLFQLTEPADLRFDAALTTYGSRLFVCPGDFNSAPVTESTRRRSPSSVRSQHNNALNRTIEESFDSVDAALETLCQLVLGPKLNDGAGRVERIRVALDPAVRRVAFIALHDEVDTFGDALILIRNVRLMPEDGTDPIC